MPVWTAGAVFGLAWMIFFLPIHLVGTVLFWQRRNKQPIKARLPSLVVSADFISFIFVLTLGIQRIVGNAWPCLLTLWSAYIGLSVLFNIYLWRCWVLFFTFQLTQERLEKKKKSESFYITNRYLVSPPFLFKVFGSLSVILILPCGILTAFDPSLPTIRGDHCVHGWGADVIIAYVVAYALAFVYFAFRLRQVVDGFKIKEELGFTGALLSACLIPWVVFNNYEATINNEIFPFSTFFLIIGMSIAFCASTVWPLYRSYFAPPAVDENGHVSHDLTTLQGVLSDKAGLSSFKKFLTKEFSVENILFYEEIEDYRKKKKEGGDDLELIGEAQRIYAKYIIIDSPFQVNLPDAIVKELESKLKDIFSNAGKLPEALAPISFNRLPQAEPSALLPAQRETPTIFDKAQENIFKLMSTDSFPRFFRSEEYAKLCVQAKDQMNRVMILQDQGLIAANNNK